MEGMILAALISTAGFYHCIETKGALECRHASTQSVARAETAAAAQSLSLPPAQIPAQGAATCALQPVDASAVRDDAQAESHAQCESAYRNHQYDSMNETWHVDRIRACDELNARRRAPAIEASKSPQPQMQLQAPRRLSVSAE
ncbi:hypothetical protein [Methylocapsa palsarum]|uniref:Uncharacterized protein n=1 Tax=Methylocapsa palsarum TaxID=1612308 RepID=A0A1I3YEU2_9HYPH|nr:hypothetical protein [Methylocapsa palsarum]SFK29899.1 hypothetical protein SAMN05444581_105191 [Methylocapsa palsarum]